MMTHKLSVRLLEMFKENSREYYWKQILLVGIFEEKTEPKIYTRH